MTKSQTKLDTAKANHLNVAMQPCVGLKYNNKCFYLARERYARGAKKDKFIKTAKQTI